MDVEQEELQYLGFLGMTKESFKIIFSCRKIFTQITFALILPLSFIFLAQLKISHLLFYYFLNRVPARYHTATGSPQYTLSDLIFPEFIPFWLSIALFYTVLAILSLFSISAVVYTVASVFIGKEISFKKVMSVVPKVWKRLMVTFMWCLGITLIYYLYFLFLPVYFELHIPTPIVVILTLADFIAFVEFAVVWHLASVVTFLEDSYGRKAMSKSYCLLEGKILVIALVMFSLLLACFFGTQIAFLNGMVLAGSLRIEVKIIIGILCLLSLTAVILMELVVQTVIYFVFKSYHHENIDKSILANHLDGYLEEYIPPRARNIQLQPL